MSHFIKLEYCNVLIITMLTFKYLKLFKSFLHVKYLWLFEFRETYTLYITDTLKMLSNNVHTHFYILDLCY